MFFVFCFVLKGFGVGTRVTITSYTLILPECYLVNGTNYFKCNIILNSGASKQVECIILQKRNKSCFCNVFVYRYRLLFTLRTFPHDVGALLRQTPELSHGGGHRGVRARGDSVP